MNIKFARDQLEKLVDNPQKSSKDSIELQQLSETQLKSHLKTSRINKKDKVNTKKIDGIQNDFEKEYQNFLQQKKVSFDKIQMKIPILKNKKVDIQSQRIKRIKKLGLQSYIHQLPSQQLQQADKKYQKIQEKIIKNLNGTYFKSTDNVQPNRNNMTNTLGIKKSSMSNYKVEWGKKQVDQAQIHWNQIGYIPNRLFPCRKTSNIKNKIFIPRGKDGNKTIRNYYPEKSVELRKINSKSLITSCNSIQKSVKILPANKKLSGFPSNLSSSRQSSKISARPQTQKTTRSYSSRKNNRFTDNFLSQSNVRVTVERKFSENLCNSVIFENEQLRKSKMKNIQQSDYIVGKRIYLN